MANGNKGTYMGAILWQGLRPETGRGGYEPRPGHTKHCKIGTYWLPAWHVIYVG